MKVPRRIGSPGSRLRPEDGVALPVAVITIMLLLTLAGVLTQQAIVTSGSANEDSRVKSSLQAADAGVEVAVSRLNRVTPPSSTTPCMTSGGWVAYTSEWCPAVTETLANGATYSYRVSAPQADTLGRWIVSSGTVDGVTRRVATRTGPTAVPIFGGMAVRSKDRLLLNQEARIDGNAASNGDIDLRGAAGAGAVVCGNATPGPGRSVLLGAGASVCPGYTTTPATSAFTLPPVPVPSPVDGNARICAAAPAPRDVCNAGVTWNASARSLVMGQNTEITLGGDVYFFCGIHVGKDSEIIIPTRASGSVTRIYIDSPANCGSTSSQFRGTIKMDQGTSIINPNPEPSSLQLFVTGSTTTPTTVNLNQSSGNCPVPAFSGVPCLPMLIYAPNSLVDIDQNVRILGAVAAKEVIMDQASRVVYDPAADGVTLPDPVLLSTKDFRECAPTAPTGGVPSAGC